MLKNRIGDMRSLKDTDQKAVGNLMIIANKVAEQRGLSKLGFRIVINNGQGVSSSLLHQEKLIVQIIGGQQLTHEMAGN